MGLIARSAAIHALTAGAIATMILAVMTRASLGHTARAEGERPNDCRLRACGGSGAAAGSASLRLIDYDLAIDLAAICWGGAFLVFVLAYAPVLWRPPGEKC
jgi:uncharacterized protein involved in response to NO